MPDQALLEAIKLHYRLYLEIFTKPGEAGLYTVRPRINSGLAMVIEQVQAQDAQSLNTRSESERVDTDGDVPASLLNELPIMVLWEFVYAVAHPEENDPIIYSRARREINHLQLIETSPTAGWATIRKDSSLSFCV